MEKRSTPNKTAKYVLVFILIAAAAAVLIFSLVNNNKPAQSKAYGESYAAALIADIQGSSAVEYTVKGTPSTIHRYGCSARSQG